MKTTLSINEREFGYHYFMKLVSFRELWSSSLYDDLSLWLSEGLWSSLRL